MGVLSSNPSNLISVVSPSPKTEEVRVFSGPDFIFLDWPVTEVGWASNFSVEIEHVNATIDANDDGNDIDVDNDVNASSTLRRSDRKLVDTLHMTSAVAPPFNVSNLVPENEYKVVITTALNDKFKTTLVLNEVFTSANNSKLPEGIIGVRLNVCDLKAFKKRKSKSGPSVQFSLA